MAGNNKRKIYRARPDRNTKFNIIGWSTGVDVEKYIKYNTNRCAREEAEQAIAPRIIPSAPARAKHHPSIPIVIPPGLPPSQPSPIPPPFTIPPSFPGPPFSPDAPNVPSFIPVGNSFGPYDGFLPFANTKQYPVICPYPVFPIPFFPPPPATPAQSPDPTPVPPEPTTRAKTETLTVRVANPGSRGDAARLPSQITLIAGHYCSVCGRLRSKEYHRQHPLAPGTIARSGPCRRCRRKSRNRNEDESDQPMSYVIETERSSRKHRDRSPERRRVRTERIVHYRSRSSSSPSPPRRRSSPPRRKSGRPERRDESSVRYRHVSVTRASEQEQPRPSRREERRSAPRREQSREPRRERSARVSPSSDESEDERPVTGSELVVRKYRETSREVSPKDHEVRPRRQDRDTTGRGASVSSHHKATRTKPESPEKRFDVRARLVSLDRKDEEERKRPQTEVTEVDVDQTQHVSKKPREPRSKKRSKADQSSQEEIEVNRVRQSSTTRKPSEAQNKDETEEAGPLVRFRYVTLSYYEDAHHTDKEGERKVQDESAHPEADDVDDEVVQEEVLGGFRYVSARDSQDGSVRDGSITSAAQSHHERSSRVETVRTEDSDDGETDVYRENKDGEDQYLGSFRHVTSPGHAEERFSDVYPRIDDTPQYEEPLHQEDNWDGGGEPNFSGSYRHVPTPYPFDNSDITIPPILPSADNNGSGSALEASNKERLRRLREGLVPADGEDAFESFSPRSQRHIRRASKSNLSIDAPAEPHRKPPISNTIKYAASLYNREAERSKPEQSQRQDSARREESSRARKDDMPSTRRKGEVDSLRSTGHVSSLKQRFEQSDVDRSTHRNGRDRHHEDSRMDAKAQSISRHRHPEDVAGTSRHVRHRGNEDPTPHNDPYSDGRVRYYTGSGTELNAPPKEVSSERGRRYQTDKARQDESAPARRPSRVRFVSPLISSSSSSHPSSKHKEREQPSSDAANADPLAKYREEAARMREWEKNWSEDRRRALMKLDRERSPPRREHRFRDDRSRAKRRQDERRGINRHYSPSRAYYPDDDGSHSDYHEYSQWHNQPRTPPPAPSPPSSTIGRLPSPPIEGFEGLLRPPVNPDPAATKTYSERSPASGEHGRSGGIEKRSTNDRQNRRMRTGTGGGGTATGEFTVENTTGETSGTDIPGHSSTNGIIDGVGGMGGIADIEKSALAERRTGGKRLTPSPRTVERRRAREERRRKRFAYVSDVSSEEDEGGVER